MMARHRQKQVLETETESCWWSNTSIRHNIYTVGRRPEYCNPVPSRLLAPDAAITSLSPTTRTLPSPLHRDSCYKRGMGRHAMAAIELQVDQ